MRDLETSKVNRFRDMVAEARIVGESGGPHAGYFHIPPGTRVGRYKTAAPLRVIASGLPDDGWDHVSVSGRKRVPTHDELMVIHRLFFRDDEVSMQLQMPDADHINCHPYVLHLWRPHYPEAIPLPPKIMVGPQLARAGADAFATAAAEEGVE